MKSRSYGYVARGVIGKRFGRYSTIAETNFRQLANIGDNEMKFIAELQKNPYLIHKIPNDIRTEKMYLTVAHHDNFTMSYMDGIMIDRELCRFAVQFNARQIPFVPTRHQTVINQTLANVKYLIVARFRHDKSEVSQSLLSYARSNKRKDKSACTEPDFANEALDILAEKGARDLNLVLIDHSGATTTSLCKLPTEAIVSMLANHPIVNQVTLLGCKTASSFKLEEEVRLTHKFNPKAGLILMSEQPDQDRYHDLLKMTNLDKVFVLIKPVNDVISESTLLYIEKTSSSQIISKSVTVSEEGECAVKNQFASGKDLVFPKNSNDKYMTRHDKSPFSAGELEVLLKLRDGTKVERFSKSHSEYAIDKKKLPFLRSFSIDETEKCKLKPSIMLSMINAISDAQSISRDITVKGYPKPVFVDQVQKSMLTANEKIYLDGDFSIFSDRINRPLLAKHRRKLVNKMAGGKIEEDTDAKSIKYLVRKHD